MQPDPGKNPPVYFDNAATSWPKPAGMLEAMGHYNEMIGGNPGRSGHQRSLDAGRIILETREAWRSFSEAAIPSGLPSPKMPRRR